MTHATGSSLSAIKPWKVRKTDSTCDYFYHAGLTKNDFLKSSYQDELRTAAEIGPPAYEKLRYPLPSADALVFFDDAAQARIISNSLASRLSSVVFSPFLFRSSSTTYSPYASAPIVYRGYDEAVQRSLAPPKRPGTPGVTTSASTPASPASRPTQLLGPAPATPPPKPAQEQRLRPQSFDGKLADLKTHMQKAGNNKSTTTGPFADREEEAIVNIGAQLSMVEGEERPGPSSAPALGSKVDEGPPQDVTDLILIIHGIGQGVRVISYHNPCA